MYECMNVRILCSPVGVGVEEETYWSRLLGIDFLKNLAAICSYFLTTVGYAGYSENFLRNKFQKGE